MTLQPLKTSTDIPSPSAKNSLLGGGTKAVRSPRLPSIKGNSLDDLDIGFAICLIGKPGSGKTNALAELILAGYKVFMVNTDAGGDNGINTIKARVLSAGKSLQYMLDHFRWITVEVGDQVGEGRSALVEFLHSMRNSECEVWDFDPDVLVWEGFATYQGSYIIDEFDESDGSVSNFKEWGKIQTATIRDTEAFFKVRNPRNGKKPYRIVTCQEGQKSVKVRVGMDASNKPILEDQKVDTGGSALKTSAVRMFNAAFDVIIVCRVDNAGKYRYILSTDQQRDSKKRVVLPNEMDADFMKVWNETKKQLGIS